MKSIEGAEKIYFASYRFQNVIKKFKKKIFVQQMTGQLNFF